MKVIDLLNKIANGEEVPKRINYGGMVNDYEYLLNNIKRFSLNDEIEIIEDTPKEIYFDEEDIKAEKEVMKKLSIEKKDNFYDYYKEDKKIEYLDYLDFKEYSDEDKVWCLLNKINEVIDELEKLKSKPSIININGSQSPTMQEPYKITCSTSGKVKNNDNTDT